MKYQVTCCTSIRDTKKSVNLRDILQTASMRIESPLSSQFGFAELQATVLVKSKQEVHARDSHTADNFLISGCLIPIFKLSAAWLKFLVNVAQFRHLKSSLKYLRKLLILLCISPLVLYIHVYLL
jgi:hypothetical protein